MVLLIMQFLSCFKAKERTLRCAIEPSTLIILLSVATKRGTLEASPFVLIKYKYYCTAVHIAPRLAKSSGVAVPVVAAGVAASAAPTT